MNTVDVMTKALESLGPDVAKRVTLISFDAEPHKIPPSVTVGERSVALRPMVFEGVGPGGDFEQTVAACARAMPSAIPTAGECAVAYASHALPITTTPAELSERHQQHLDAHAAGETTTVPPPDPRVWNATICVGIVPA